MEAKEKKGAVIKEKRETLKGGEGCLGPRANR